MPNTPESLTKKFGIPPEAGQGRAIPRALLAYTGCNKARFLATTIALIMNSALPEYGQKTTYFRDVDQAELAGSIGLKARETFTRWLSEIATPDESWDVDRRIEARKRTRYAHQQRGHRLHDSERPSRAHLETLISRRRRYLKPNRYAPAFPGHIDRGRPNDWFPPTMKEAKENELLQTYFRKLLEGDRGFKKFKHLPQWLWSPALPLSWKARLVMSYYFMCGLGSKDDRTQKTIGVVRPYQRTVADAIGISVRSVYNANQELERLGLIRVAHERIERPDGSFTSGPQIIVYLPIRQLTQEEASEERERLQSMLAIARGLAGGSQQPWMLSRVKELHNALLSDWEGKEHSLKAFWNQVRRSAISEGIHLKEIERLIPNPPN